MLLWILIAVITVAVALFVLKPLAASSLGAARRGDYDLQVYESQIEELEAEAARGVISQEEARGARNEIERRMLQAVRDSEPDIDNRGRNSALAGIVIAIALPVSAGLIYLELGRPDLPAQPLAERTDVPSAAGRLAGGGAVSPDEVNATREGLASVGNMVASLEERLAAEPDDFDGWMLLGRSYGVMDRYGDAAEAYSKAAALPEGQNDPSPHMQKGEALIFASGGVVTEPAVAAFERTLEIDPGHPGARYYIALARGQAGDLKGAYDGWLALARESPADAPWQPALRQRLEEVSRDLGIDMPDDLPTASTAPPLPDLPPLPQSPQAAQSPEAAADAPGPTAEQVQAAQEMTADDRQAMIRGMVERLADRLAEEPDDFDGWMRLGRAYGVLGNQQGSLDAYRNAVRLRPNDIPTRITYGGALIDATGDGTVTPEAAAQFEAIAAIDADNPDALFVLGQADAQAGRDQAALTKWRKLLGLLQPGTPAYQNVAAQIQRLENRSR
ncbi:c-type cytochrome biogenesis protein CcmI [Minwuia sp.]|uniref:c-type cytochrome biogenesis protein CcmI n=1 Tax=Minwuia sp. TaxID=2493630 RepID=UPI003A9014BC